MANHPELDAEQAYINHAYECLERSRRTAESMREEVVEGRGGTFQNRYERDVIWERVGTRLQQLEIGDRSLIFGRIDPEPDAELDSEYQQMMDGEPTFLDLPDPQFDRA